MTDPIADLLTRIRNAARAGHESLKCPRSNLKIEVLRILKEEGFVSGKISQTIICNYLSDKKLNHINHLILACTHYPLIQDEIEKFYHKSVNVINSSELVVKYVKNTLHKESLLKETKENDYLFYTSNYTVSLEKSAKFFFNEAIKLIELNIHNDSEIW